MEWRAHVTFGGPAQPVRIMETCAGCKKPIPTWWMNDGSGMISKPEYLLVADWVYHAECWKDPPTELPPLPPRKENT